MKKINKLTWILLGMNVFLLVCFIFQLNPVTNWTASKNEGYQPQWIQHPGCHFSDEGHDYLCHLSYVDFLKLLSILPDNFLIKKLMINTNKNFLFIQFSL